MNIKPPFHLGLGGRFALVLSLIGMIAAGLTGYHAFTTSRDLLVRSAEQRLLTATQVLVRQLVLTLEAPLRDARMLAHHPMLRQVLAGDTAAAAGVHDLFSSVLETRPEYFQVRLIGRAQNGLEQIRIDRADTGLVTVTGDDLQEKGHHAYVYETLRLSADRVFVSLPAINHEEGAHAGLGKPAVLFAVPIYVGDLAIGMVVINVDVERIFKQLSADLPSNIAFMLTNRVGDFLVHPDQRKAFAFDRGQRARVQDSFPATAALFEDVATELVTFADGAGGQRFVATFAKYWLPIDHLERGFVVGLSQPLSDVVADSDVVGNATGRIVAAFSLLSVVMAILLARAIIRPLNQVLRSVEQFTSGQERMPLPVQRQDEVGVLARSIDALQRRIDEQMSTLQDKQHALDHLASHDSLTGLPNRRLFLDRLEHALARSRRTGQPLTLLFIDLDDFKEINDRLGHAAGDGVLQTVADRLRAGLREIDTVARLGGDEFIVLLDATDDHEVIAAIAAKMLEALAQPVQIGDESVRVGGSIGIGSYPRDGSSSTALISAADNAMYRAKNDGRNRFRFASDEQAEPERATPSGPDERPGGHAPTTGGSS